MQIHTEKREVTSSGGTGSVNTMRLHGGLCRQIYVKANTSSTVFRFDVTNDDGLTIRSYDYHKGEINDDNNILPVIGIYTLRITDSNIDDTFKTVMVIEE